MADNAGLYEAVPLNSPRSIRILQLERPVFDSQTAGNPTVNVILRAISLDDKHVKYQAVSYTWGPPIRGAVTNGDTHPYSIICNDRPFPVTENLFRCLQQLIKNRSYSSVWVDAICIDQSNIVEKCQQVNLMANIYSTAQTVLIWLGEADENADIAVDFIQKEFKNKFVKEIEAGVAKGGKAENIAQPKYQLGPKLRKQLLAMALFFDRTWFTRIWVVQEFVLAPDTIVLCGDHVLRWDEIAEVSHCLATTVPKSLFRAAGVELQSTSYKNPAKLAAVKRGMAGAKADTLLYSLVRMRNYNSCKRHDKVFALVGIHKTAMGIKDIPQDSPLYPNYSKEVGNVYIDVATYILRNRSDLLLLAYPEGENFQRIPSLPSWVPDWSVQGALGLGITGYERFNASGTEPCMKELIFERNLLRLRASLLDKIVQVGETKEEVDAGAPFMEWLNILESMDPDYHTGVSRQEAFWRTLVMDTGTDGKSPAANMENGFKSWMMQRLTCCEQFDRILTAFQGDKGLLFPWLTEAAQSWARPDGLRPNDDLIAAAAAFDDQYSHSLLLQLFLTDGGYLGAGSSSLRNGDSIWIVPGSRIPLILRPFNDEKGHFKLVGGTYVHGFMQGEATRDSSFSPIDVILH